MKTRQALTNETAKRYRTAGRKDKTKILDEFVGNTGYCRKYALHILANWDKMRFVEVEGKPVKLKAGKTRPKKREKRAGKPVYLPQDISALKAVWDFFRQPCGKRLASLLRAQMPFLVSCLDFGINDAVAAKLLKICPATIDLRLREEKNALPSAG